MDLKLYGAHDVIRAFSAELRKGRLAYAECNTCSQKYLPPRAICAICGSTSFGIRELENRTGVIVAKTSVYYPPARFSKESGYVIAVVEFEKGLKFMARLRENNGKACKVGDRARLVIVSELPDVYLEAG